MHTVLFRTACSVRVKRVCSAEVLRDFRKGGELEAGARQTRGLQMASEGPTSLMQSSVVARL